MTVDIPEEDKPLQNWNRLNNENTKQDFVSALYQSMSETTFVIDKFSTWLLAGTGATGALLVMQIQSVLPHLTVSGYRVCVIILVVSAIFGFIAKYYSIRCEIQNRILSRMKELATPIIEKHEEDKEKIQKYAAEDGIKLYSEIDLKDIMKEFSRPFSKFVRWLILRSVQKATGDRQAGYHAAIKSYMKQANSTLFQAILFLAFMLSAAGFANTKTTTLATPLNVESVEISKKTDDTGRRTQNKLKPPSVPSGQH